MKQFVFTLILAVGCAYAMAQTAAVSEKVQIQGDHGKLAAVIQKPALQEGEKCPMVMFCHGFNGRKEGPLFEQITDSLQAHGIASIRFDFNGHGESEGAFEQMTVPNEIIDAKYIYNYVRALDYVNEVAIVGHSQGGVVSSMLAGELGTDAFRTVVLMAPAAVLREDAIRGNTFGKMYNPLSPPESVEIAPGTKLGRDYIRTAFSLPIYETAAGYQGEALIIHGNADRIVPYTYGERFHKLWSRSRYVLLEGYDHGFGPNVSHATDIVTQYLLDVFGKQTCPLYGKRIGFLGDSYVRNHRRPFTEAWHYKLADKYNMEYHNYGRNGSKVSADDPRFGNALYKRYATDMNDSLDYVVVIAGHNDASALKEIGGIKEYEKRLNELLDGLQQRFPSTKILWFTCWGAAKPEKTKDFQRVIKSTQKLCKKHGIPVFDASKSCIKAEDDEFRKKYFQAPTDGAHLNYRGHDLFLPEAEAFILNNCQ
ncbi:MAG: alpha/beta fold hydrolase [Bacteroidales bacterium]|nr:alpha/beta fold hydrolase [Bacteroidales bacterium]